MTDLLNIGRSGIAAYARSLETVSQNIANSENPDYVRRTVKLGDATTTGSLNPLYASVTGLSGVRVQGVERSVDEFLEVQLRQSGSSRVRTETSVAWLQQVETILDNAGNNVGSRLNTFFAGAEELASVPFDSSLRGSFLTDLNTAADSIRRTADNLQLALESVGQGADAQAVQLNSALRDLARINVDLIRTPAGTEAKAGLLDARDTSLAIISEKLDARIVLDGHGAATVSFDGTTLVNKAVFAEVTIDRNPDRSLSVAIDGTATRPASNGTLAGFSNSAAVIGARMDELDALAQQFVDDLNAWHANGVTDAHAPGAPLLVMTGGAATLTVAALNIADLALASADGSPNGNLLELNALRTTSGVETRWTNLIGGHANVLAAIRSESAGAIALHEGARQAREDLSQVNIDREAADLIRLQQAYDASARVIQVARETIQSILAIF
jgi:flagellar hook-associated protein 1 FlgK